MKALKQHQEAGFIGISIILLMCATIGLFGLKVLPLYIENISLNEIMDNLVNTDGLGKQGKKKIIERFERLLSINDIDSFHVKDAKITRSKAAWVVTADYDARVNYIANIDIVVHFEKTVEIPR